MSDRTKNVVVTITFLLVLVLFFAINLCTKDIEISYAERRKLTKFPQVTVKKIFDGSLAQEFDKYSTDQMIKREDFRKLKALLELDVFRKKDNNNIYLYQDRLIKIEYPLNEVSITNATNKINTIQNDYLQGMKCYYTIVPDKNYFVSREEYIGMDYEKLEKIMTQNLNQMEYIPIFDCLQLQDYYVTDIHWKQENLQKVVDRISSKMNFKDRIHANYTNQDVIEFDGVYAGQLAVKTAKDKICIVTNEVIENATVYNYENKKETKIYDKEKLSGNDKYDIYLSGPTPLITITNPKGEEGKELVVFRDSFASSLVPLFTEAYYKITLVDIRYMRSKDIGNYIEFKDQDILFIYSTTVLNNSSTFK